MDLVSRASPFFLIALLHFPATFPFLPRENLLAVHPMGVHPPVTTREVICHVFPYNSSIHSTLT